MLSIRWGRLVQVAVVAIFAVLAIMVWSPERVSAAVPRAGPENMVMSMSHVAVTGDLTHVPRTSDAAVLATDETATAISAMTAMASDLVPGSLAFDKGVGSEMTRQTVGEAFNASVANIAVAATTSGLLFLILIVLAAPLNRLRSPLSATIAGGISAFWRLRFGIAAVAVATAFFVAFAASASAAGTDTMSSASRVSGILVAAAFILLLVGGARAATRRR